MPSDTTPRIASHLSIERRIKLQSGGARSQHIIAAAPAGCGKTTLLRHLSEQARSQGVKIAWVTLLSEHEDTATFVASIVEALHGLQCGFSLPFHKDAVPGHATGLRGLCREICSRLARVPHRVALFIDDFHAVRTNEAIGLFVEELTHAAPQNFQLVLASRSQPNFSTIRLRLDNRLLHLGSRELQFDVDEARQFYKRVHGLAVTDAQLTKILARTDGWAAGLQLVGLALQRSPSADDVIDALSGNFHEITEYLACYVIEGLAPPLVDFLLDTSVLDRLNTELCIAVTEDASAGERLVEVQALNLFVRPLDETHTWFGYHQLFRDFLRARLNARDANRARQLHQRASAWYAQHGLPDRAIEHALAAGDHDSAAQLVEDFAQERIDVGGMADVERWINMIPAEVVTGHPRFQVFKAWALCHICKYHEASDLLRALERNFASRGGAGDLRARELEYELAVLQAVNSLGGDNVAAALASLPDEPPEQSKHIRRLTAMKSNVEGACHIFMSRFAQAELALTRAYTLHRGSGSLNGVVYALCYLGYVRFLSGPLADAQGKFEQAEQEALLRSGRDSFCCALARALLGLVADERDETQLAESLIVANLTPIEEGAYIGFRRALFLRLARMFMDRGESVAAEEVLHRLLRSCDEIYVERTQLLMTLERARHALRSCDIAEAERLIDKLPPTRDVQQLSTWQNDICEPGVVRVHHAFLVGEHARALQLLQPLRQLAETARRLSNLQELLVLEAQINWAVARPAQASTALRSAFEIAYRTDRIRACADSREPVLLLAKQLGLAEDADAITANVLRRLERSRSIGRAIDVTTPPAYPAGALITSAGESLSARELVILQLVARGMRNKQAAVQLNISEHTVRWHVRNVLEKLNVTNRTAAVNAARELGLLTS